MRIPHSSRDPDDGLPRFATMGDDGCPSTNNAVTSFVHAGSPMPIELDVRRVTSDRHGGDGNAESQAPWEDDRSSNKEDHEDLQKKSLPLTTR